MQGSALLSLSYSRSAESEADRHAVELMYKAGRDPHAIGHFLELIRDKLGDKEERDFLSTHPATPERIADTLRYADEIAGKPLTICRLAAVGGPCIARCPTHLLEVAQ